VYKEHHLKAHLTSFLLVPVPELADHVGMPFRWLLRGYTAWCVITTTKVLIRHPQHVCVLKVANIMLQATFTHFSCRWCCPSFQLRTLVRLVEHVRILTITTSCDIAFQHFKWTSRCGLRSPQARTVTFELGTRTLQHGLVSAVGQRFRPNRCADHTKCLSLIA
jgi:hypothetical protein